jgi:XTP/dITP diphosphohydrolase
MKKLLIATHNPGKYAELSSFLSDLPLALVSLSDMGITEDVVEDGLTYEENAIKKATFYAKRSGIPALSDDGGLEIAALNNAPGVRSKRWIGEDATEDDLLRHMESVVMTLPDDNRAARFVNIIAVALPTGDVITSRGSIEGIIAKEPSPYATKGLPYRKFFFLPQLNTYYDEKSLTPVEMKRLNHRLQSVELIKPKIAGLFLNQKH